MRRCETMDWCSIKPLKGRIARPALAACWRRRPGHGTKPPKSPEHVEARPIPRGNVGHERATRMLWGAWQFRQPASRHEPIATALKTNRPSDCRAHIFVCLRGSIGKPLPHGDASKTAEIIWTYDLGAGGEIMWVKKSRAA